VHLEALNLREIIVFLIAAGVVVPLAQRFRISPVLGFLVVGVVIGPFGLVRFADSLPWLNYAVISDLDGVRAFAELGWLAGDESAADGAAASSQSASR